MKKFYVDWNLLLMSGDEIGRVTTGDKTKIAIHRGNSIEVVEAERVFDSEIEACRFALRELNGRYKDITEQSQKLLEHMSSISTPVVVESA